MRRGVRIIEGEQTNPKGLMHKRWRNTYDEAGVLLETAECEVQGVFDSIVAFLNGAAVFFVTALLLIGLGELLRRWFGVPKEAIFLGSFVGASVLMFVRLRYPEWWWIKRRTILATVADSLRRLMGRIKAFF